MPLTVILRISVLHHAIPLLISSLSCLFLTRQRQAPCPWLSLFIRHLCLSPDRPCFFVYFLLFFNLVHAALQLYKPICWSVHWLVNPSVCRLVADYELTTYGDWPCFFFLSLCPSYYLSLSQSSYKI